MHGTDLLQLLHRSGVDLLLSVEARAHGPFVEQVQQASGLDQTHRCRVRQHIDGKRGRDTHVEQLVPGLPGLLHGLVVEVLDLRVPAHQHGRNVVGFGTGSGRQQRTRTRHHAMPLVLRVRSMAQFLDKRV